MEKGRIPNKLKFFRHSKGYSQKKVARILGLNDTSAISRWEHGLILPGMLQVFRLSRIYNSQPEILFDELWQSLEAEYSLLAQNDELVINNQSFYI